MHKTTSFKEQLLAATRNGDVLFLHQALRHSRHLHSEPVESAPVSVSASPTVPARVPASEKAPRGGVSRALGAWLRKRAPLWWSNSNEWGPTRGSVSHRIWHRCAPDRFARAWPVQALRWSGVCPLGLAARFDRPECVAQWLPYCDTTTINPKTGRTPLMEVAMGSSSTALEHVLLTARVRAGLNQCDKQGRTALSLTLTHGLSRAAQALARCEETDRSVLVWSEKEVRWYSPLYIAWSQGDAQLLDALTQPRAGQWPLSLDSIEQGAALWSSVERAAHALAELAANPTSMGCEIEPDWVLHLEDVEETWTCIATLVPLASETQMEAVFPLAPLDWLPEHRAAWERAQLIKSLDSTPSTDRPDPGSIAPPQQVMDAERQPSQQSQQSTSPSLRANKRSVRRL